MPLGLNIQLVKSPYQYFVISMNQLVRMWIMLTCNTGANGSKDIRSNHYLHLSLQVKMDYHDSILSLGWFKLIKGKTRTKLKNINRTNLKLEIVIKDGREQCTLSTSCQKTTNYKLKSRRVQNPN